MTIRTSTPLGAPTWIDLATSDLDRAVDFYGAVGGTRARFNQRSHPAVRNNDIGITRPARVDHRATAHDELCRSAAHRLLPRRR